MELKPRSMYCSEFMVIFFYKVLLFSLLLIASFHCFYSLLMYCTCKDFAYLCEIEYFHVGHFYILVFHIIRQWHFEKFVTWKTCPMFIEINQKLKIEHYLTKSYYWTVHHASFHYESIVKWRFMPKFYFSSCKMYNKSKNNKLSTINR